MEFGTKNFEENLNPVNIANTKEISKKPKGENTEKE